MTPAAPTPAVATDEPCTGPRRRRSAPRGGRGGARRRVPDSLGPLLFHFLLSLAILAPLASRRLVRAGAGDLLAHVSGIVEARNALDEGQFPIRVTPLQNGGVRYPMFSYYGNLPYTVGGLLYKLPGVGPFMAWKIAHVLFLTLGGFYAYRCARGATRRPVTSALAGAVFVLAPYMWADVHARWAYTELVSFNLLPVVFFYAGRSFATRRLRPVLLAGIAWCALALSHNITYLYGSLFLGLFYLLHLAPHLRTARRLLRVGAGYALGLVLALWFLAPQILTLDYLTIAGQVSSPVGGDRLTKLPVLLSPFVNVPPEANTPYFIMQIGWPVLAGVLLAVAGACLPGAGRRRRLAVARLAALFALIYFVIAMPSRYWQDVPTLFWNVQSSYRLLMFLVLFGALLFGHGLALWSRRDPGPRAAVALAALLGLSCVPFLPRHTTYPRSMEKRLAARPDMGGNGARENYLPGAQETARAPHAFFHPDEDLARREYGLVRDGWLTGAAELNLPAPADGGTLVVEGAVPAEAGPRPVTLAPVLGGRPLPPAALKPGEPFAARFPVPGGAFAEPVVRLALPIDRYLRDSPASGDRRAFPVSRTYFEYPPHRRAEASVPKLVTSEQARVGIEFGKKTRWVGHLAEPVLLQLPVLYYPGLQKVRSGGIDLPFGNLGPYVAVRLPEGRHRVDVTFVGLPWANAVSAGAWIVTLVTLVTLSLYRRAREGALRPRRRPAAPAEAPEFQATPSAATTTRAPPWAAFTPRLAVVCFGAAAVILSAPAAARWAKRAADRSPRVAATASASAGEEARPEFAVDGDEATAWMVASGADATLTLTPSRPARLGAVVLESRQSGLYEAWHGVRADLYRDGGRVGGGAWSFPEAATQPAVRVLVDTAVEVDRIELHFTSPVCVTRDGGTRVDPRSTNPGYREVRLEWER